MKKILLLLCILLLTGCADKNPNPDEVLGFLFGLWHGFVIVFAFIASCFDNDVAVYATNNNGFWYNLGYVLGLHIFFNET